MRKCANCEYFDGSCKRFPPTVKNIGHNTLTRHPVDGEDWCGEFVCKPEKQPVFVPVGTKVINTVAKKRK